MNSTKSAIVFALAALILVAVVWGFIHGAKMVDVDGLKGAIWMVGSVLVGVLGTYLSWKLKK